MSCCSECVHMNLNDENSYREYYCGYRGHYYPGSDSTCGAFSPRTSPKRARPRCCSDCVHMNTNDENSYGEYYCGKKGRYYPGSDNPCNEGESREISGGCYITTAVCCSLNKPDDCYELNTFRQFRDTWLKLQPDGEKLISEYYEIAPKIVDKINTLNNAQEVYASIWQTYLKKCLHLIESKNNEESKRLYIEMVETLKTEYLE